MVKYISTFITIITFIFPHLARGVIQAPSQDYQELPVEDRCQDVSHLTALCNITSFKTIRPFTNSLQHHDIEKAVAELHKYAFLHSMEGFNSKVQLFLCSLYLPICVSGNNPPAPFLLPCREECEKARNHCLDKIEALQGRWPWDCSQFKPLAEGICVNVNVTSTSSDNTSNGSNNPPQNIITSTLPDSDGTSLSCGRDMFNCQIQGHLVCVEDKLVCDGKPDCQWEGKATNLDEQDCEEKKCSPGQFYCDGKCLVKAQSICNGQVECSSGIDEQNCDMNLDPAGVIYATVVAIAALLSIFWCINRLCIYDDEPKNLSNNFVASEQSTYAEKNMALDIDVTIQQDAACPIYNEPANSDYYTSYQRLNIGGNSGKSSVYNGLYNDIYDTREPPAAPPPTPNPQIIYSNE